MSQEIRKTFAKNIAALRRARNIKREELSLYLGLDNSYISKLEKGKINITIDKIGLIADFFEISASELFKK